MAFANDMGAAQDAAPRKFKICRYCGKKGSYMHNLIVARKIFTYENCRYCKRTRIIRERDAR